MDTREKIRELRSELESVFVEREAEIGGLITAMLAREHVLLIGPPGTAKSALARAFAASITGADHFERLLTRFSTPEELFGPISMSGLREDRYQRVSRGMIQRSHVAFLDEVFKANSAILNSLLGLINERRYDDGSGQCEAPLMLAIGASNELPEGEELSALYDRFLVRFWTRYTDTQEAFEAVLFGADPVSRVKTRVGLGEWQRAQAEVAAMPVDVAAVSRALYSIRAELAAESIVVSDRRWRKCIQLMKAAAWLAGDAICGLDSMDVLPSALWNVPDQKAKIAKIVTRHIAPELATATELYDAAVELVETLPKADAPGYVDKIRSVHSEIKVAWKNLSEIENASVKGVRAKIAGLRLSLEAELAKLRALGRQAVSF